MDSKIITIGHSSNTGIFFPSKINQEIGVKAFFDEKTNIKTKIITYKSYEFEFFSEMYFGNSFFKKHLTSIFNTLLVIIAILTTIVTRNFYIPIATLFFCLLASSSLTELILHYLKAHEKEEKYCCFTKFHSAEHMVLNAYEKLQKVPSLAEVNEASQLYKDCGIMYNCNKILTVFMYSLLLILIPYFNTLWYFIIVFLGINLFLYLNSKFCFLMFLQLLFLRKPSDKQMMLAIEGLRQLVILETKLKNNETPKIENTAQFTDFVFTPFNED